LDIVAEETPIRMDSTGFVRSKYHSYGARLSQLRLDDVQGNGLAAPCPNAEGKGTVSIRIYRTADTKGRASPCVVFPGGAFIKERLDSGDSNARGMAQLVSAVAIGNDSPQNTAQLRAAATLRCATGMIQGFVPVMIILLAYRRSTR
jgi:hypothetical protein